MSLPHSLVLRWHEDRVPKIIWYLRGIRPDGFYYGTIRSIFETPRPTDNASGISRYIDGKMTPADTDAVFALAAAIRSSGFVEKRIPCRGVLADGPIHDAKILYRFWKNESDPESTDRFLEIVRIIRPYLAPIYPLLDIDVVIEFDDDLDDEM